MTRIRSFLNRTLLFLVFPVLVLIFLEFYNRNRSQNEILAKLNLLEQDKSEVAILAMGNSHVRDGINPDDFELNTLNIGMMGSSFFYEHYLLNRFVPEMPSLKYVILTASYHTLFYNMEEERYLKRRYEYFHYTGADYRLPKFDWKKISLVQAISFPGAFANLELDLLGRNSRMWNGTDFVVNTSSVKAEEVDKKAIRKIRKFHELMDEDKLSENLSYLRQIISLCKDNDIKLILITTPVTEAFKANRVSPYLGFTDTVAKLAPQQFTYIDFTEDKSFDLSHFKDSDHLNFSGAQLLSKKINRFIMDSIAIVQ